MNGSGERLYDRTWVTNMSFAPLIPSGMKAEGLVTHPYRMLVYPD